MTNKLFKYITCIALLCIYSLQLYCQKLSVEEMKKYNTITVGVEYLGKYTENEIIRFIDNNKKSIPDTLLVTAYMYISYLKFIKYDYKSCLSNNEMAKNILSNIKSPKSVLKMAAIDVNIAKVYMLQGNTFFAVQKMKKALYVLLNSQNLLGLRANQYTILNSKLNLANAYNQLELFDSAIVTLQSIKLGLDTLGNFQLRSRVSLGLLEETFSYYYKQNNFDSALYYLRQWHHYNLKNFPNEEFRESPAYLSRLFAKLENFDSSKYYYDLFINQKFDRKNPEIQATIDFVNGDIASSKKEYSEALYHFNRSLKIFDSLHQNLHKIETLKKISKVYEKMGNLKLKNYYLDVCDKFQDSLNNLIKYKSLELVDENIQNGLDLNNMDIDLTKKNQFIIVMFVSAIILILIIVISFHKKIRQNKIVQDTLTNKITALNNQGNDFKIAVQLEERKRLASDIHDGLGASITSARLNIEQMLKKNHNEELEKIKNLMDNIQQETRTISHALTPGNLEHTDFTIALQNLCKSLEDWEKYTIEFVPGNNGYIFNSLSLPKKTMLYRLAQEMLVNAIKHSQADYISLSLSGSEKELVMIIEDNGKGFNNEEITSDGIGLKNSRERCESIGGTFSLDSEPGRGCIVQVTLPV